MSEETCLCIDLRGAAQNLTRRYDAALAPAGISVTQFSQLHTIQMLAQPTLQRVAEATGLDRSTLGRNVRVLEAAGMVSMSAGEDARTRVIKVTRKGRRAFQRAVPLWSGMQSEMKAQLGGERYTLLKELLSDLKYIPESVGGTS